MLRKLCKYLFSLTLLLFTSIVAVAMPTTGRCGKGVTWTLVNDTLIISGTGDATDETRFNYRVGNGDERDCWGHISNIIIEEGVKSLGSNMFRGCTELLSVKLPSSLVSIKSGAFKNCPSLSCIIIPSSVQSIGNQAFADCSSLEHIIIPPSVKSIGDQSFADCSSLQEVQFSYGLETIGKRTFEDCKSLRNLSLPLSTKAVGERAFANCTALVNAKLSPNLENLGKDAFKNNTLASVEDLPTHIAEYNCDQYGLSRLIVKNYWDKEKEIAIAKIVNNMTNGDNNGGNAPSIIADSYAGISSIIADVDTDIPISHRENRNTYALILCNENYSRVGKVPYAINDGNVFLKYCRLTLGIPENNICLYKDATYAQMKEALSTFKLLSKTMDGNMKLLVYYAGHGAPDEKTLEPFLIPVDVSRVNPETCLSLKTLYADLNEMNLESATVFIDACFSGMARDGESVFANERGILRMPKKQSLNGKTVVLSATSNDQTALPYEKKNHGMFTYFLLKRLKETSGNITLGELADYLKENVSKTSLVVNKKEQTPSVSTSSSDSATWSTRTLID